MWHDLYESSCSFVLRELDSMPFSSSKLILRWWIMRFYVVLVVSVVQEPLGSEDVYVWVERVKPGTHYPHVTWTHATHASKYI